MDTGLSILPGGALDFVSLGALIHRLDTGVVPFRKATECRIHVSGGEFNCAANLADCFGMKTGIVTAMVDYPVGELIDCAVRAMGVKPFYKRFKHNGVSGPNMAAPDSRASSAALVIVHQTAAYARLPSERGARWPAPLIRSRSLGPAMNA